MDLGPNKLLPRPAAGVVAAVEPVTPPPKTEPAGVPKDAPPRVFEAVPPESGLGFVLVFVKVVFAAGLFPPNKLFVGFPDEPAAPLVAPDGIVDVVAPGSGPNDDDVPDGLGAPNNEDWFGAVPPGARFRAGHIRCKANILGMAESIPDNVLLPPNKPPDVPLGTLFVAWRVITT